MDWGATMIRTQGVHHLALTCKDMDRTVEFYTRVLGMQLSATLDLPGGWKHFFFDMGGGNQLAFFWFPDAAEGKKGEQFPGAPWKAMPTAAMHHIAFAVEDVQALERARETLIAEGIRVTEVWDHDFCKSIYFRDPDGIQLELAAWVRPLDERDLTEPYRAPKVLGEPVAVGN
jgi:catechol 2,3-dioxygenase-like lactoylglutathione lyase family enzyme